MTEGDPAAHQGDQHLSSGEQASFVTFRSLNSSVFEQSRIYIAVMIRKWRKKHQKLNKKFSINPKFNGCFSVNSKLK